ncbi:MAG: U32 family peptidase, partial [Planctomycetales bacterium]|nr:U32 family peptidase [Planctomycetales bacterium]
METEKRIELLAPAGNRECIAAAIENGADAVYFGLQAGFNARARATNLAIEDAEEIFTQLHQRGVRGYVTLNTLVFMDELSAFEDNVRRLAHAGADAVLVQDVGAARLIRAVCPDLPVHASTQMTLSSAETIRLAEQLGIQRVVLARELAIDEIRDIASQTNVELEAFAHGALCVAYSGQCLTSESLGGRSANRGQCAQACRLPYELYCDGQHVGTDNRKYLLSPQDLAAIDLVPQMIDAGISCLKIEGRLKTPEYVANVTGHYRRAIDAAMHSRPHHVTTQERDELQLSFSRGFSPGWLQGCDHKMLVPADSSSKRGILIGRVDSVRKDAVRVILQKDVAAGDGVVFDGDRLAGNEQGGRVYSVRTLRDSTDCRLVELRFGHHAIDFRQLYVQQRLWKTDDPQLT